MEVKTPRRTMTDTANYSNQLAEARKAFEAGKYSDAANTLKLMPQDDLKVKHNLVAVQYMQRELDATEAAAQLQGQKPEDERRSGLTLAYDGHETALYNRAAIYARSGLLPEAVSLLRSLLEIANDISISVLTNAICLFQTLTRPAPKLGSKPRSKPDEDLVQRVLKDKMAEISSDAALLALVTAAFADSSTLNEVFKGFEPNSPAQTIYLNNLGVVSMSDGKTSVGSLCFTKALKAATQQPNSYFTQQSVAYNAGLCALLRGGYEEAIKHFLDVQETMKASPLYWVRFAEAAVGAAQNLQAARKREEYERQQSGFSALLQTGKVYANFEFMLLPGAVTSPGPVQEPRKESSVSVAAEQLAATAVQNALFLLVPQGTTPAVAAEAIPHREQLLQYALLYWTALELIRRNYLVAAEVGQELLTTHERRPLPATLHVALLSYVVEALIHINDADKAMKVLRKASLSSLLSGSPAEHTDAAQRSRMEALFVNLAVTHVLVGSWNQAHSLLESLLAKIYEAAPTGATEYRPERDVMFAYQMLAVFLELAQNNAERAAELLVKVNWSI